MARPENDNGVHERPLMQVNMRTPAAACGVVFQSYFLALAEEES